MLNKNIGQNNAIHKRREENPHILVNAEGGRGVYPVSLY